MRIISYLFLLLIVLFGITFAALNAESVTINYYIDQATLPLSLLLVIVFALGCLIGVLTSLWLLIKMKLTQFRLKSRLKSAEKEILSLRNNPPTLPKALS
jgi:putative membrane protein